MATDELDARAPVAHVVDVDTAVVVEELVARAAGARRVRIHVPAFTDGRFFSQVRALAESATFDGEIQVHGDLLPDQVPLLARYGVVEVVLDNGLDPDDQPRHVGQTYRERRQRHRESTDPRVESSGCRRES